MKLRPAQEAVLQYRGGRMAVSAVPGSGKTFTLSLLAAQLIAEAPLLQDTPFQPDNDQAVLVVTYLNASVDTFRARIRRQLEALDLPPDRGYDVRTLHSLALEIVRLAESGLGRAGAEPLVLDDTQSTRFLAQAVDTWIEQDPETWRAFLAEDTPQARARWRDITTSTARAFIRAAKNERHNPRAILERLDAPPPLAGIVVDEDVAVLNSPLLRMMAGIYSRYQTILDHQGAMDFDDLIWRAADLLEERPSMAEQFQRRWPFVLEDEAQDSVPLQEVLLSLLTGPSGNWVRVGDPNQAITSTFTAAHPRFFNAFLDRPDVTARSLPNSGRNAPLIMGAANAVLDWVIDQHPVPEVRRHTFRRQHILPTPPGDAQPNPADSEAALQIKVFRHREDEELPGVARLAVAYAKTKQEHTLAILVPTHQLGHTLAEHLDDLDADYDNLLRGGTREREIAAAMHAVLAVLADPLDTSALVAAHASLYQLDHPAAAGPEEDLERFRAILRSVHRPEALLFPADHEQFLQALPASVATEEEEARIERLASFLRGAFALRPLPIDDLALALGDELFAYDLIHEGDLAIAYQIATVLRYWREAQPEWRLPDLVAELAGITTGRRSLPLARPSDYGYEPQPSRITLATQHSAKGLEWDAVFLVGIDGFWIPSDLQAPFLGEYDFLGGDPVAEAGAQLRYLMHNDAGLYEGRSATESAHIDVISERLRLLYVGITRARRFLHLSRSRGMRRYRQEQDVQAATVLGVLYQYLRSRPDS